MLWTRWWICIFLIITFLSVGSAQNSPSMVGEFCVAIATADPTALQEGLNWACGPGGADCSPIQEGQPCYVANNLVELASYAYNDYYHKAAPTGTCSFNGTATTTNTDPSHDSCIFTGSTQAGTTTNTSTSTGMAPSPTTSLFAPPPPGITGFTNTNISSTDGTFSMSSRNAASLRVVVYTASLLLMLHLLSCYI